MKKKLVTVLWVAALVPMMACSWALAADSVKTIVMPRENVELNPGPGRDRVLANCLPCHSLDYIPMQPASTKAQWAASVTKMIKVMGARVTDDDARVITDYLGENYVTGK